MGTNARGSPERRPGVCKAGHAAEAGSSMECRIESKSEASHTVVTISGRLSGHAVEELRRLRRSIEGTVILDLSSLVSASYEGVKAIRALFLEGDETRSASPFVELLLRDKPRG